MQQRQRCLPDGSSVKREFQALFCEKPEVQSLRLTLPICARLHHSGDLCQSCQFATHTSPTDETKFEPTNALRTSQAVEQPSPTPLTPEGAQFVRVFVTKTELDRDTHPIESVEVARFRLLGTMIGTSGNDNSSLAVSGSVTLSTRMRFSVHTAVNICSHRVFRILTQRGHWLSYQRAASLISFRSTMNMSHMAPKRYEEMSAASVT